MELIRAHVEIFRACLPECDVFALPEVPLLFSFDVDALDDPAADLAFNGPDGLPLPRPRPLVVPLFGAEVVDFLSRTDLVYSLLLLSDGVERSLL
jgi:hypothetical protein